MKISIEGNSYEFSSLEGIDEQGYAYINLKESGDRILDAILTDVLNRYAVIEHTPEFTKIKIKFDRIESII